VSVIIWGTGIYFHFRAIRNIGVLASGDDGTHKMPPLPLFGWLSEYQYEASNRVFSPLRSVRS
jgi:hypothetical protein